MLNEIRRGVLFTLLTMALFGGGYHLLLRGIGSAFFPAQAEGSLVRRPDGTVVGSRLIAQRFTRPEYVHSRPSAVDYNAAATGGSNLGPSSPEHLRAVQARLDAVAADEATPGARIPSELVTASGSGMDPHLPPRAVELQAARIARRRGVDLGRVRAVIAAHVEPPALGVFGRARVNVLALNLALDATFGPPADGGEDGDE